MKHLQLNFSVFRLFFIRLSVLLSIAVPIMFSSAASATVTNLVATVDKNPVMLDESVQLMITATGDVANTDLDLSAVDKDFRRSRTSISRSTQSINFNTTKTTTWTTQLFPNDTGRFTIPAFTIDGQSTRPFDVLVVPVSSAQGGQARQFYVTADVDKDEVYLQQQIRYTVKIFMAGDIQRGSLQSPELSGAVIQQLGEDKEYQDIQNGVRYRVIERNFAIIPQSSGTYSIDAPVFQGEVLTDSRQGFGFFNRTKSISRSGPRQEITVKPIPVSYTDHWLPSEFVQLNEEWQGDINSFVVGEPITRTLTLTAAGLVEEQLPEISAAYPPQFKTYPDQASTATVDRDNMLFAQRIENIAVIPSREGTFVMPEVIVPWFNVLTQTTEYAKLPARSVQVGPAEGAIASASEPTPSTQPNSSVSTSSDAPISTNNVAPTGLDMWHWILIASNLLFLVLVVVLVLFRSASPSSKNTVPRAATDKTDADEAFKRLKDGLSKKDYVNVQKYLLVWLQIATGQQQNSIINILESLQAKSLIQHYNALQASLYKQTADSSGASIDSSMLVSSLDSLKQALREKESKTAVQTLYSQ